MSNFVEIRSVGAQLFHADGRTDRHDEASNRFSQFCDTRLTLGLLCDQTVCNKTFCNHTVCTGRTV